MAYNVLNFGEWVRAFEHKWSMRTFCQKSSGRRSRARGAAFSLVELMVASVIAAIMFIALFRGLADGYHLIQVGRENMRATQIMLGKMEAIRLCAWGSNISTNNQLFTPTIVTPSFSDFFYPLGLNSSTNQGTPYRGTISVQTNTAMSNPMNWNIGGTASAAPSYGSQMAVVTVTVSWTNYFNGQSSVLTRSMKTYVARFGVQNYVYYAQ